MGDPKPGDPIAIELRELAKKADWLSERMRTYADRVEKELARPAEAVSSAVVDGELRDRLAQGLHNQRCLQTWQECTAQHWEDFREQADQLMEWAISPVLARNASDRNEALKALGDAGDVVGAQRAEIDQIRAELDAVKAKAVVLPNNWRREIAMLDEAHEAVETIEMWQRAQAGPAVTEATEQAPREPRVWSVGDDEPGSVAAVTTPGGAVFKRDDNYRWRSDSVMHGYPFTWSDLVGGYPFMTEVIEDGAVGTPDAETGTRP